MRAEPIHFVWENEFSIYASEGFLQAVGDKYGWIGGVADDGKLKCVLPYTIVRKSAVKMARFRVETIAIDGELQLEQEKGFLENAVSYLSSLGADLIIPAATNAIFQTCPKGAIAAPYGTLAIDLTESEEQLWRNVHAKHRNVIRNAQKAGVTVHSGMEYAGVSYDMIRNTFARSGIPFMSKGSFDRMLAGLGEYVKIMVAESGGTIQGCAVIPFSKACAYYAYGGSSTPRPLTGAINHLQWEAILSFRRMGVRRYDFCGARLNPAPGSKQAGLYMFKERFGARLHMGVMWKQYLKPVRSLPYRIGVHLLRGGDVVDQERKRLMRRV